MKTKYGIIGTGMMGQEHIRNIQLLENTEITALSDPDSEMLEKSASLLPGQVLKFSDYRELIRRSPCDAYIVAAPNDMHHSIVLELIDTGKPILCEKPVATTSAKARDIMEKAGQTGTHVWVAMEYRFMPATKYLLDELATGKAGDVKMVSVREHRFPFLSKVGDWNRFNVRTGGTMVEKCCHFWDLMRLITSSEPVQLYASGGIAHNHLSEQYDGNVPDIIDNAFVILDFANGMRGMLDLCMFAEGNRWQEEVCVTGTRAELKSFTPGPLRFSKTGEVIHSEYSCADRETRNETRVQIPLDPRLQVAGDHHGSTFEQHLRFLDLIRNPDKKPEVTPYDGYRAVLIGEAAEESIRTGKQIYFEKIK